MRLREKLDKLILKLLVSFIVGLILLILEALYFKLILNLNLNPDSTDVKLLVVLQCLAVFYTIHKLDINLNHKN